MDTFFATTISLVARFVVGSIILVEVLMLTSKVPSFPSKQEESIVEIIKGALPLVGSFARISKALNGSPPIAVE